MWQHEAASRAAVENGTEEGLGESSEFSPIAFPQDVQMEEDIAPPPRPEAGLEPARNPNNNLTGPIRRYQDQMVLSITTLVRADEDETSPYVQNSVGASRGEVPGTNMNVNMDRDPPRRDIVDVNSPRAFKAVRASPNPNIPRPHYDFTMGIHTAAEDSTAESSSTTSRRERDGGVVPVWSPLASAYSDQFVGDENGIGASSLLAKAPSVSSGRELETAISDWVSCRYDHRVGDRCRILMQTWGRHGLTTKSQGT